MNNYTIMILAILASVTVLRAMAGPVEDATRQLEGISAPFGEWNYLQGDVPGAEKPDFDDSAWKSATPDINWGATGLQADPAAGREVRDNDATASAVEPDGRHGDQPLHFHSLFRDNRVPTQ